MGGRERHREGPERSEDGCMRWMQGMETIRMEGKKEKGFKEGWIMKRRQRNRSNTKKRRLER